MIMYIFICGKDGSFHVVVIRRICVHSVRFVAWFAIKCIWRFRITDPAPSSNLQHKLCLKIRVPLSFPEIGYHELDLCHKTPHRMACTRYRLFDYRLACLNVYFRSNFIWYITSCRLFGLRYSNLGLQCCGLLMEIPIYPLDNIDSNTGPFYSPILAKCIYCLRHGCVIIST